MVREQRQLRMGKYEGGGKCESVTQTRAYNRWSEAKEERCETANVTTEMRYGPHDRRYGYQIPIRIQNRTVV